MAAPASALANYTVLLPLGSRCSVGVGSSAYPPSQWRLFPAEYTAVTPETCAHECDISEACTGFTTDQRGVKSRPSDLNSI